MWKHAGKKTLNATMIVGEALGTYWECKSPENKTRKKAGQSPNCPIVSSMCGSFYAAFFMAEGNQTSFKGPCNTFQVIAKWSHYSEFIVSRIYGHRLSPFFCPSECVGVIQHSSSVQAHHSIHTNYTAHYVEISQWADWPYGIWWEKRERFLANFETLLWIPCCVALWHLTHKIAEASTTNWWRFLTKFEKCCRDRLNAYACLHCCMLNGLKDSMQCPPKWILQKKRKIDTECDTLILGVDAMAWAREELQRSPTSWRDFFVAIYRYKLENLAGTVITLGQQPCSGSRWRANKASWNASCHLSHILLLSPFPLIVKSLLVSIINPWSWQLCQVCSFVKFLVLYGHILEMT